MFGKKNGRTPPIQIVDFSCKVCGTNCLNQVGLERHTAWAHRASGTTESERRKDLATTDKQK